MMESGGPLGEGRFKVGNWEVDPRSNSLRLGERCQRVEPRVMEVLCCLAEKAGRAVTRTEILERVWPQVTVSEDSLNTAVSKLRRILSQDPAEGEYLETLPKVGYRLLAPVEQSGPSAPPFWKSSKARPWIVALLGAAAAALAITLLPWAAEPSMLRRTASFHITPLTTFEGLEVDPAYGPGDRIAFAWNGPEQDNFDLYLIQPGEGVARRLTRNPSADQEPTWAPDGSRLAYLSLSTEGCQIRLVSALGGQDRKLADCLNPDSDGLHWRRDGKGLLLSERPGPNLPFRIYPLTLEGRRGPPLTSPPESWLGDFSGTLSPDGRWLAFLRSPTLGVEDIWIQPLPEGPARRLTGDGLKIHGLDWSRGGDSILFSSNRGGLFSLWSYSLSQDSIHLVTGAGQDLDSPSASPDSDQFAYLAWTSRADIERLDLSEPRSEGRAIARSTRWDWSPALSPDGQRLAFVSDRSGHPEVWLSRADGDAPRRLTDLGGPFIDALAWSPDGLHLAFETRGPDGPSVLVLQIDGGSPSRLGQSSQRQAYPSWSHDGERLYFASEQNGSWQIYSLVFPGGSPVQVTQDGGLTSRPSSDGKWLYFTRRGRPGIWRMPSSGGPSHLIVSDFPVSERSNWALAGEWLFFVQRPPGGAQTRLMRLDLKSGERVEAALLPRMAPHSALALSADARFAYLSTIVSLQSDIMLLGGLEAAPSTE
ncbi:MAG TPA: winged helix-turn-helix domain-containing protein [Acidobacteriota bacterium]|nr:winged helix-turn-helix domain-containing protein [Acidobacteriota bacterium]